MASISDDEVTENSDQLNDGLPPSMSMEEAQTAMDALAKMSPEERVKSPLYRILLGAY